MASPPPGKWLQFQVKPKLCTWLGNLLTNAGKKLDIMKHIHFKSQVSAQEGICQSTASSSPLLKNDCPSFQLFPPFMLTCQYFFPAFRPIQVCYLPSTARLRSFWSCARIWEGRDTLVPSCEWWSLLALSRIPLLSCTLHIPWKQYSNGL